jgi:hypothetical protein
MRIINKSLEVLDKAILSEIKWVEPCEALYDFLVKNYPEQLVKLIKEGNLEPWTLTFAVEYLGKWSNSEVIKETLFPFLDHKDEVVREGTLYGLADHVNIPIYLKYKEMYLKEISAGVKMVLADEIQDFEKILRSI